MPGRVGRVPWEEAGRNILRSRGRSATLFVMQAVIVTIFLIGNSILVQSGEGLKRGFIDGFTGDGYVKVGSETPVSLFGAITPSIGEYHRLAGINDFDRVLAITAEIGDISDTTPISSGLVEMKLHGTKKPVTAFGVDWDDYPDFFPDLNLTGRFPRVDENGVVIPRSMIESISREISIGDTAGFFLAGDAGFRIRELHITGIIDYGDASEALTSSVLMSNGMLAEMLGATGNTVVQSEETDENLFSGDLDSLFGEPYTFDDTASETVMSTDILSEHMGGIDFSASTGSGSGDWNFILLRFADGSKGSRVIKVLNRELSEYGLEADDWKDAAGISALLILLLRVIFNGGFLLVTIAGTIAVVNLLTISVIERTGEIGTLRAIGARRAYIRRLLYIENFLLSFFSGIVGIAVGSMILGIMNRSGIELENSLLRSLFGQSVLHIGFSLRVALLSITLALVVGTVATVFPVSYAMKILPAEAVMLD